ncbi:hypothetical protein [Mesonia aquimarina]|uniref:hypothetical protein n=1 Tax=Mesonia aquimarina TaxID=1504967 RepID=UPI000EF5A047|nr:hypothetical protein [Mesonia aquimarina]
MNLQDYIKWLYKADTHSLEVYNYADEKELNKSVTSEWLSEKFTDPMDYFAELLDKGYSKIIIQRIRKWGSSSRRIGIAKPFLLSNDSKPKQSTKEERVVEGGGNSAQAAAPTQPHFHQPAMSSPGLSGEQSYKIINHDKLERKFETLEDKYESAKEENQELKIKLLKYELGVEGKPGVFEKLMESFNPDTISTIVNGIVEMKSSKPEAVEPALNAVNLSRYKGELIKIVSRKDVSDDAVQMAYQVIDRFMNKDEEFLKQYTQLVQQSYKKQNENATSSS